jgi:hypothetical protein
MKKEPVGTISPAIPELRESPAVVIKNKLVREAIADEAFLVSQLG